jgi:hypothetical protein
MSKTPLWETVILFLGILCLWPAYILRWEGWHWRGFAYVMLVLLVVLSVRRLRRVKATFEEQRNGKPPLQAGGAVKKLKR